jgi:hypothetical protein
MLTVAIYVYIHVLAIPEKENAAMSTFVSVLIVGTLVLVVSWLIAMLRRAAASGAEGRTATLAGATIAAWAGALLALAAGGAFVPRAGQVIPPVGIALAAALAIWWSSLAAFPSLWRLLARAQPTLVRMQLWRSLGPVVFLAFLAAGRLPALFALPAALGDLAVGVTALRMARAFEGQRRRSLLFWHAFGVLDLVVALTLGVTTNPGPANLFHTVPSSQAIAAFPLVLIPTFLVPLALTLHYASLRLMLGKGAAVRAVSRERAARAASSPA